MRKVLGGLLLGAVLLAGCSKSGIDGKWNATGGDMATVGATSTMEFSGDKVTLEIKFNQQGISLGIVGKGTYTLKGETITMNFTDFKVDDSKVPAQFKSMLAGQMSNEKLKEQFNKSAESVLKFTDADTATLTDKDGKAMTLTRVKS